MRLVIFGLTISSSWGNGHATIWRGLCRALAGLGHSITFFEQDVAYYAIHRDFQGLDGLDLVLYPDWDSVATRAHRELEQTDIGIVTSYCPDAVAASEIVLDAPGLTSVFYDMDTPITLQRLRCGAAVEYMPPWGLAGFDLVLSFTGGPALDELRERVHATRVRTLYGSVDPDLHRPVPRSESYRADLSYLGTYAANRQLMLERLFIEPARRCPGRRFVIGGAQYPDDFPWIPNIWFVRHLPPPEHPAFYCSSNLTLNVTRSAMAEMGYCPSGRLFEAAACATPVLSDSWAGLDEFFEPGREILVAHKPDDVVDALTLAPEELKRIALAARDRVFAEHTAEHRASRFVSLVEAA